MVDIASRSSRMPDCFGCRGGAVMKQYDENLQAFVIALILTFAFLFWVAVRLAGVTL